MFRSDLGRLLPRGLHPAARHDHVAAGNVAERRRKSPAPAGTATTDFQKATARRRRLENERAAKRREHARVKRDQYPSPSNDVEARELNEEIESLDREISDASRTVEALAVQAVQQKVNRGKSLEKQEESIQAKIADLESKATRQTEWLQAQNSQEQQSFDAELIERMRTGEPFTFFEQSGDNPEPSKSMEEATKLKKRVEDAQVILRTVQRLILEDDKDFTPPQMPPQNENVNEAFNSNSPLHRNNNDTTVPSKNARSTKALLQEYKSTCSLRDAKDKECDDDWEHRDIPEWRKKADGLHDEVVLLIHKASNLKKQLRARRQVDLESTRREDGKIPAGFWNDIDFESDESTMEVDSTDSDDSDETEQQVPEPKASDMEHEGDSLQQKRPTRRHYTKTTSESDNAVEHGPSTPAIQVSKSEQEDPEDERQDKAVPESTQEDLDDTEQEDSSVELEDSATGSNQTGVTPKQSKTAKKKSDAQKVKEQEQAAWLAEHTNPETGRTVYNDALISLGITMWHAANKSPTLKSIFTSELKKDIVEHLKKPLSKTTVALSKSTSYRRVNTALQSVLEKQNNKKSKAQTSISKTKSVDEADLWVIAFRAVALPSDGEVEALFKSDDLMQSILQNMALLVSEVKDTGQTWGVVPQIYKHIHPLVVYRNKHGRESTPARGQKRSSSVTLSGSDKRKKKACVAEAMSSQNDTVEEQALDETSDKVTGLQDDTTEGQERSEATHETERETIEKLQKELTEKETQLGSMRDQLQTTGAAQNNELQELHSTLNEKNSQIKSLESNVDTLTAETKEVKAKLMGQQKDIASLRSQNTTIRVVNKVHQDRAIESEKKLREESAQEKLKCRDELDKLQKQLAERTAEKGTLQAQNQEMLKYRDERDELQRQLAERTSENTALSAQGVPDQGEKLENKTDEQKKYTELLIGRIIFLDEVGKKRLKEVNETQKQMKSLRTEYDELRATHQEEMNKLDRDSSQGLSQIGDLLTQNVELKRTQNKQMVQLESMQAQISSMLSEKTSLESQSKQLQTTLAEAQSENDTLRNKFEDLQGSLAGVNARVDDLQRQNDKLVAEGENDQSQVKLTEAEAQNKKIQEQVGDLKLRISEMVSTANKSEAQNVELQNKLNDLQDELKKAQHQNDTLVPRHKKPRDGLTELQSQHKALQAQYERLESEVNSE